MNTRSLHNGCVVKFNMSFFDADNLTIVVRRPTKLRRLFLNQLCVFGGDM